MHHLDDHTHVGMQPSVRRHDLQGVEPLGREPGHLVRADAGHGERPGRWLHLEESVIGGLFGSRQRLYHGVALRVRSRDRFANLLPAVEQEPHGGGRHVGADATRNVLHDELRHLAFISTPPTRHP